MMGFYVTPASQDSFSWLQQKKNIVERFERNVLTSHTYTNTDTERDFIYITRITKWRERIEERQEWREMYEDDMERKKKDDVSTSAPYTHITCCAVDLCHCIYVCTKWEHNKRWSSEIILLNSIFCAYEMLALTLLLHFMALSDRNVPKATQTHTHTCIHHSSIPNLVLYRL